MWGSVVDRGRIVIAIAYTGETEGDQSSAWFAPEGVKPTTYRWIEVRARLSVDPLTHAAVENRPDRVALV